MKISVTNEAARKLLRRLEADQDPEVRDFVAKVEQGLQPGMMLASEELMAVLHVLSTAAIPSDEQRFRGNVARAIPKLELMLQKTRVREQIETEQRRRGR